MKEGRASDVRHRSIVFVVVFVVVAKPDGIRAAPAMIAGRKRRLRIGELVEYRLEHALLKGASTVHDSLRGRVGKRSTVKKTA